MKFIKHITLENNKGDFNFAFLMQEGASWAQAKESASEIYMQIVHMEAKAIAQAEQNAAQQVEPEAEEVTPELN